MYSYFSNHMLFRLFAGITFSLSLASCSVFETHEYTVKDSLYVWSESFDEEAEANKVVTDYQTIKAIEASIPKSDVQFIFDAMINNEIENIDTSSMSIRRDSTKDEKPLVEVVALAPVEVSEKNLQDSVVIKRVKRDVDNQLASTSTVDDINRLTQDNPSAAGIPVSDVLPKIKTTIETVSLSNELLLLSSSVDYQQGVHEYGMWQLAKHGKQSNQAACTLSSATMQVDAGRYSSQVWLNVVGNNLLVNTTTNIDIQKPYVGVAFDKGSLQAFTKNYFPTSAVWSGNLEQALAAHTQLSISLGSNELNSQASNLSIPLKNLKKAYAEYQKCNAGTRIGSL